MRLLFPLLLALPLWAAPAPFLPPKTGSHGRARLARYAAELDGLRVTLSFPVSASECDARLRLEIVRRAGVLSGLWFFRPLEAVTVVFKDRRGRALAKRTYGVRISKEMLACEPGQVEETLRLRVPAEAVSVQVFVGVIDIGDSPLG
jgi:hypothetical protein